MVEIVISFISKFADDLFGSPDVQAYVKWIILGGVFILIELLHRSWMIIWFTLGALAATIVAFFLPNESMIQIGTFFLVTVVSLGLFVFLKPPAAVPDDTQVKSGRKVICTKNINNDLHSIGAIMIDGVEFRARLTDDSKPAKKGQWLILEGWGDRDNLIVSVRPMAEELATEEVL